ncbi:cleavage and polyadenylation specificity factor subunit 2 [Pelobates cultripes]|uniref:Cleavage and polyadenylation specificity factor subunit 2 n=1 Tax=Pelobates cultripes TaxID=61616 RepID=A0AAD1WDV6_PELCU|nr:cleavage and polyadenylation specificity factor subunit 2 [Pelobates cultripes]
MVQSAEHVPAAVSPVRRECADLPADQWPKGLCTSFKTYRAEDFLVSELQATEEEKSKLESDLANGEEPMDQDLSDVPTKCVSTTELMEIKARVTYIDYEGRSDGDSIKKIINQMKPRLLVIVHGLPDASQDLAEACRAFGGKDIKVHTPKLHETVDATSETHIYQV